MAWAVQKPPHDRRVCSIGGVRLSIYRQVTLPSQHLCSKAVATCKSSRKRTANKNNFDSCKSCGCREHLFHRRTRESSQANPKTCSDCKSHVDADVQVINGVQNEDGQRRDHGSDDCRDNPYKDAACPHRLRLVCVVYSATLLVDVFRTLLWWSPMVIPMSQLRVQPSCKRRSISRLVSDGDEVFLVSLIPGVILVTGEELIAFLLAQQPVSQGLNICRFGALKLIYGREL